MFLPQLSNLLCTLATMQPATRVLVATHSESPPQGLLERTLFSRLSSDCFLLTQKRTFKDSLSAESFVLQNYRDLTSALLIATAFSNYSVGFYSRIMSSESVSRLRWVILTDTNLKKGLFSSLPWLLDNKILTLCLGEESITAWDVYRPTLGSPVFSTLLTSFHLPKSGSESEQLEDQRVLAEDPWKIRSNLSGLTLKCSTMTWSPAIITTPLDDGTLQKSGLVGDLLTLLEEALTVKIVCRRPKDGMWGTLNSTTGLWNGVLGEVIRREVDIAGSPYVYTKERAEYLDYSEPILPSRTMLVIKRPKGIEGSSNFTREFSFMTWLMVGVFFIITVIMMTIFTRVSRDEPQRSIVYCLITTVRIYCNMGFDDEKPSVLSYRCFLLTVLMTSVILHVHYDAFLTAVLSSSVLTLPFTDLNGLYANRDKWTLGITADSYLESVFNDSKTPLFQRIYKDMVLPYPHLTEGVEAGLQRVLDTGTHAFLVDEDFFMENFMDCRFLVAGMGIRTAGMAIPVQKEGPANPIINYKLRQIVESGILDQLKKSWYQSKEGTCESHQTTAIGLSEMMAAFVMMGIAIGISHLKF